MLLAIYYGHTGIAIPVMIPAVPTLASYSSRYVVIVVVGFAADTPNGGFLLGVVWSMVVWFRHGSMFHHGFAFFLVWCTVLPCYLLE